MPDLETRLPELLRELSTEASVPATDSRRTVARAKRRRLANAGGGVLVVLAILAGSVLGVRALMPGDRHRSAGGTGSVTPAPAMFRGIWPETTATDLATAQAQVDDGHTPLRLDPEQTAAMLATSLFGWQPGDVQPARTTVMDGYALVVLSNRVFGDDVPPITVELERLGRTGPDGIWTVVDVSSSLFDGPVTIRDTDGTIAVTGTLRDVFDGSTVHLDVLAGATEDTSSAGTVIDLGELRAGRFDASLSTDRIDDARAVLWVRVVDATGSTLDATAVPLRELVDGVFPAASPAPVPPTVEATRDAIVRAVGGVDFDAMRSLMDPNTFAYNFDDGSDPIPAWKQDPSVLDPILTLLQMQPAAPKRIEGYGTFYVWPYLVDSDLSNLSPPEIDDLHRLGFDDAAIDDMRRFGSYSGPRLAIDADGLWRNYTTGGD